MRLRTAFVSLIAFMAAATPAAAGGTLFTPPVFAASADVYCMVQNIGAETTSATARLYNGSGVVVDENVGYPIYTGVNSPAGDLDATGSFYCAFEGLGKGLRGFIVVNESGQSVLVLPTVR